MLRITLVLFIVGGAVAEIIVTHICVSRTQLRNFNVAQYKGLWYEFGRYDDMSTEITSKCGTAYHKLSDHGSFVITDREISLRTNKASSIVRKAKPVRDPRYGEFTVRNSSGSDTTLVHYEVLETDYHNYALVRSCTSSAGISFRILTRARYPPFSVQDQVNKAMRWNQIIPIITDQKNCPEPH